MTTRGAAQGFTPFWRWRLDVGQEKGGGMWCERCGGTREQGAEYMLWRIGGRVLCSGCIVAERLNGSNAEPLGHVYHEPISGRFGNR